jgi:hypothetical protein
VRIRLKLIGLAGSLIIVGICPLLAQDRRLLGTARSVVIKSDVVYNKKSKYDASAIPYSSIHRTGLLNTFREVVSNPDIILKFHKDVFLIGEEKISLTVYNPEDNSVIYAEERDLLDEENDVERLVAHLLARVKSDREIAAADAWREKDRNALNNAQTILTFYSSSESLKRSLIEANREGPNKYHIYLREVADADSADVILQEKVAQQFYTLTLIARDTKELLHLEHAPLGSPKHAITSMARWISSTPWESDAEPVGGQPKGGALSLAAAEYKARIEEALSEQGLAKRVQVRGTSNTLILAGKLRPPEHATLLKFIRNGPAAVHVVDDILYDETASEKGDNSSHPVPAAGKGAVHVITDVIGATATLYGPAGRNLANCTTPCSFNDLDPKRYSLQVQKDGYQSVQIALELKIDESQDQRLHLESRATGLLVTSVPVGADIFINGAKQSGQTPVTLPLAPGQYDLVLRLPGYEAYAGHIQVKENVQTSLAAELKEKSLDHVAWAQVTTTPSGAEIFIDGKSTGQFSPARVQMPTGGHTIMMKLNGFQLARRGVQVSEGGMVIVTETLKER